VPGGIGVGVGVGSSRLAGVALIHGIGVGCAAAEKDGQSHQRHDADLHALV